jgi:hypothetical protein
MMPSRCELVSFERFLIIGLLTAKLDLVWDQPH